MQFRQLGKQGPDLSTVGYGAWEIGGEAYGPNPSDPEVVRAIHAALDAGINWVDTAEIYGRGKSEILVGLALKGRRSSTYIATKVAPRPTGTGFRPEEVRTALKESLKRLGTDHVDLYQLHWFPEERDFPIEDTWAEMHSLVQEGLVRWIGVSNFSRDEIERCLAIAHVDSMQPQFSMLYREHEELIAWCGDQGVGVVVYGPLAYGLLTGAITADTEFSPEDWRSGKWPDHPYYATLFKGQRLNRNLEIVESLRAISDRLGITTGQLALAWVVGRQGVTSAIAGSRNPAHNAENAAAGDVSLSDEDFAEIDSILEGGS